MTEETNEQKPFTQKISSRRFILAMIFTVGGTIGLFTGDILSEHYYWLAGAVLTGIAATEFAKKKPT